MGKLKVLIFWKLIGLLTILNVCNVKCESNVIGHCLQTSANAKFKECLGEQSLFWLQKIDESDNFTFVPGVMFSKSESDTVASRSVLNLLDQDPMDFRGLLENTGAVLSHKNLQWDLSRIYPGLCLRVGPSADANSLMEFMLDPSQQVDERVYLGDEPSTGRILTQKLIVPFLLGLKFNLIAVVPLIFGIIIILCKKAAFLAKFALFLSSLFGFGSLFSSQSLFNGNNGFGHGGFGGFGGFGGIGGGGGGGGIGGGYGHIKPIGAHGYSLGDFASEQEQFFEPGYYRTNRKYKFDRPREYSENAATDADHFYDFEKNALLQNKNFQLPEKNKNEPFEEENSSDSYRTFAWKTL